MKEYLQTEGGLLILYSTSAGSLFYNRKGKIFVYIGNVPSKIEGWSRSGNVTLKELERELKKMRNEKVRGYKTFGKILLEFKKRYPDDYIVMGGRL